MGIDPNCQPTPNGAGFAVAGSAQNQHWTKGAPWASGGDYEYDREPKAKGKRMVISSEAAGGVTNLPYKHRHESSNMSKILQRAGVEEKKGSGKRIITQDRENTSPSDMPNLPGMRVEAKITWDEEFEK